MRIKNTMDNCSKIYMFINWFVFIWACFIFFQLITRMVFPKHLYGQRYAKENWIIWDCVWEKERDIDLMIILMTVPRVDDDSNDDDRKSRGKTFEQVRSTRGHQLFARAFFEPKLIVVVILYDPNLIIFNRTHPIFLDWGKTVSIKAVEDVFKKDFYSCRF